MLSEKDLKFYQVLCSTLNLTRASERLNITQPALSIWIKKIESETGLELFIRSKKGLELTPAGLKLKIKSKELIEHWENFLTEIKEDEKSFKGIFNLGVHPGVALYTLPPIFTSIQKNYPNIELKLKHDLSRHLTEEVISAKLDLALVMNPVRHPDLVLIKLLEDQMNLFKSKELKNTKTLIYNPHLIQAQAILKKIKNTEFKINYFIETDSFEIAAELARKKVGMAILPNKVAHQIDKNLQAISDANLSIKDELFLIYRSGFQKSPVAKALIETIKNIIKP